ncbi:MAG: hypothetical protein PHC54_06195 [Candidatus Omnitrophica bacterium]|nr:hypothetical protein [Candidatus Omnitrophota bacterium]MDD5592740.1 hypothetical protein [Candidatus Omnitrophota bacterium]
MKKKKLIFAWAMLVLLTLGTCGCAVVGAAVSAGIAYGIYQATK